MRGAAFFFSEKIISPHRNMWDRRRFRHYEITSDHQCARPTLYFDPPHPPMTSGYDIANNPLPYPQALNWGRSDNVLACPGLIFRFGRVGPPGDDGGCCLRAFSSRAERRVCDCSYECFFSAMYNMVMIVVISSHSSRIIRRGDRVGNKGEMRAEYRWLTF